jgi:hypothetical protein
VLRLPFYSTPLDLLTREGFIASVPDSPEARANQPSVLIFGCSESYFRIFYPSLDSVPNLKGVLDTIRLLMYENELDTQFFSQFNGPEEGFLLLKQQSNPPYYSSSFPERASVALSLIGKPFVTARLFQIVLSEGVLEADSYKYHDAKGNSIIHAVAGAFGQSVSYSSGRFWRRKPFPRQPHDLYGK